MEWTKSQVKQLYQMKLESMKEKYINDLIAEYVDRKAFQESMNKWYSNRWLESCYNWKCSSSMSDVKAVCPLSEICLKVSHTYNGIKLAEFLIKERENEKEG